MCKYYCIVHIDMSKQEAKNLLQLCVNEVNLRLQKLYDDV